MTEVEELVQFLQPTSRFDLKRFATMTITQLTGTEDGLKVLQNHEEIIKALVNLFEDQEVHTAMDSFKTIINITATEEGCSSILSHKTTNIIDKLVQCISDENHLHSNLACGILANLSRASHHCREVLKRVEETEKKVEGLVFILCQIGYNKRGATLDMLATFFTNISQLSEGRSLLMQRNKCVLERLLPFISNKDSKERRKAIIGVIHNCCFDKDQHVWLLSEDIDLASRLAYPLAGPDTFTEEENDKLPLDLQFLPDDKQIEPDLEIRKMLLEALMQLCQTEKAREMIREQNIYLILREHHKWEEDKLCVMLNEDLVNIIVRTEYEIGVDDISTLDVPDDLKTKFVKMDEAYLAEDISEKEPAKDESISVNK